MGYIKSYIVYNNFTNFPIPTPMYLTIVSYPNIVLYNKFDRSTFFEERMITSLYNDIELGAGPSFKFFDPRRFDLV